MISSTASSEKSWEPQTLFVCLALLVAASLEIDGLANDLRSIAVKSHARAVTRSASAMGRWTGASNSRAQKLRVAGSLGPNQPGVQAIDLPDQRSRTASKPPRRRTRRKAIGRSFPSAPSWEHRFRRHVRSCVLTTEIEIPEVGRPLTDTIWRYLGAGAAWLKPSRSCARSREICFFA